MSDRILTFAGNTFTSLPGLKVFELNTNSTPKKAYTSISIPGRNGSLLIDEKRFDNINMEYTCVIAHAQCKYILADLKETLLSNSGYQRLEDSWFPYEFYMAVFKDVLNVEVNRDFTMAKFKLAFERKPQRFQKDGEIVQEFTPSDNNQYITHVTHMESKPLIRIYGTGGQVGIGDYTITVTSIDEYVDIDCEAMEAYKGAVSCNQNIILSGNEFPVLKEYGGVPITLGTGIDRVTVQSRDWRI